jgi:hypothetical protein
VTFKRKAIVSLILCFIYNFFINSYYRPFIYKNNINDLGFADIGNNIIFIPSIYLLLFLIRGKHIFSKYKDIVFHLCFLSIVEFLSAFLPHIGTFDWKDILGLVIGAIILLFSVKNEN